jgi:hypothetical protein
MNTVAFGALLLSILPMPVILRYTSPQTAPWAAALTTVGSAILAVGFFCLWQWLQYPVLAYLDAILYGLFAVQAVLVLVVRRLNPDGGRQDRGAEAESQVAK